MNAKPPKVHAHPDDLAEEWLAEEYEEDDSPGGVGYERGHMIDAFRAGWDKARELTAAALERQAAPELAAAMAERDNLRALVAEIRTHLADAGLEVDEELQDAWWGRAGIGDGQ